METIHFSPTAAKGLGRKYKRDDGLVVRPAKVFECGDYPDKGFSLTEEEADAACRAFAPVHNNVEHRPSVFDRLLGTTEGLFRKGKGVYANLVIPEAVDALLGDAPIPLSAEWTPDPKRYKGTALTVNPRVLSAAAHAFAASPDFKTFAAEHPSEAAELVAEAAKAPVQPSPMLTKEQKTQEAKQAYAALPQFMRDAQTEDRFVEFATEAPVKTDPTDPATKAQADRLEKLEKDAETRETQFAAQKDAYDAKEAYGELLSEGRIVPAKKEEFLAKFSKRRAADRATLTFSSETGGDLVKEMMDEYKAGKPLFTLGPSPIDGNVEIKFGADDLALKSNPFYREPKEAK